MATVQRRTALLVPAVLVVAVVVAALTLGRSDDKEPPAGGAALPGSPAPTEPAEPTEPAVLEPDQWCPLFRAFADANLTYVATPGDDTAASLLQAGTALLDAGQPLGLGDDGMAGLRQLVTGALAGVGGPTEVPAGPADPAALDQYLATTCPA